MDDRIIAQMVRAVGTPVWVYGAGVLRRQVGLVRAALRPTGVQVRYAMKACSATRVLREMQAHGLWIDAVSGNEVLRARHAGFGGGHDPPVILYTSDVFRDDALAVVMQEGVLPNLGSRGMLDALHAAGYRGPIALRVNPGFGHGHVLACDTGGPSSKHGIWWSQVADTARAAETAGLRVVMLHAHIGSGPQPQELFDNLQRLVEVFVDLLPSLPQVEAVSLGGGLPYNYQDASAQIDLARLAVLLHTARARLEAAARRPLRLEIEPGRFLVAPAGQLVMRVTDVKHTAPTVRGRGMTYAMVDAGMTDLLRPALYGAYHHVTVLGRAAAQDTVPVVVAGPLCESGDVFTRHADARLAPRQLPPLHTGDLLVVHDAGAYGYAMSSNYNSIGRAPQIWLEEDGSWHLLSRRETLADLLRLEGRE